MRGLTLATMLAALPACTIDNPLFGFGDGSDGSGSGSGSDGSATTGAVSPTDATSGSTSAPGETTGASVTTGTTSGPGTSQSGTTDVNPTLPSDTTGDTTGEPLPACAPTIDDALDPHFYVNDIVYTDCQQQTTKTVHGKLEVFNGALTMEFNDVCGAGQDAAAFTLGKGYPLPNKFVGCATAKITWDKTNGDCSIGLLEVRDTMTEKLYYLGAFNNYPAFAFPIEVMPAQKTLCGCPDAIPGCCAPLDAGDLTLSPAGNGPIPPQQQSLVALDDMNVFNFYNIESYVDAACTWHIDWIAAAP